VAAQLGEHGPDVVVEVEVLERSQSRVIATARSREAGGSPPIPTTIRSCEREPELLVVAQLGCRSIASIAAARPSG
jgi:hypothetical protein